MFTFVQQNYRPLSRASLTDTRIDRREEQPLTSSSKSYRKQRQGKNEGACTRWHHRDAVTDGRVSLSPDRTPAERRKPDPGDLPAYVCFLWNQTVRCSVASVSYPGSFLSGITVTGCRSGVLCCLELGLAAENGEICPGRAVDRRAGGDCLVALVQHAGTQRITGDRVKLRCPFCAVWTDLSDRC